jgi:hypothetical protein
VVAAAPTIEKHRANWRVVARPFTDRDHGIYSNESSIAELVRETCIFAEERARQLEPSIPEPSQIVLAYVVAPDSHRLLDAFGHSVWPIPLEPTGWTWPAGKHWRNDVETVVGLLRQAITQAESEEVKTARLRLEARRTDDAVLLPGRNFHIGEDRLERHFIEWRNGTRTLDAIADGVSTEVFPFERLARFYSHVGGRNKRYAVDARGLVFPTSNNGQHGQTWQIPKDAKLPIDELRRLLEGLYRFGTPLPPGFQHDVQWEGDRELVAEQFDCARAGTVKISGTHANVYPNDVVR